MSAEVIAFPSRRPIPPARGPAPRKLPRAARDPVIVRRHDGIARWEMLTRGPLGPSTDVSELVGDTPCIALAGLAIGLRIAAQLCGLQVYRRLPDGLLGPSMENLRRIAEQERVEEAKRAELPR